MESRNERDGVTVVTVETSPKLRFSRVTFVTTVTIVTTLTASH
jgi:hypothetical protein